MKKTLLFLISLLVFGSFLAEKANAGASDNVWGWAYSENIGWISFNSTNTGAAVNYGVNIASSTGIFSGYAWSRGTDADIGGVGWISFADYNGDGVVNSSDNICPSGTCQAKLDFGTNEVSGWARALTATSSPGGWDGWIRLRDTTHGVSLNPATKEFEGWAAGWDDTTSTAVIGWISFNHKNCDIDGDGTMETGEGTTGCPPVGTSIPTYKVLAQVNSSPSATPLPVSSDDYCDYTYPPVWLSWNFNDHGDTQSAYQVQTATNLSFTPTTTDITASTTATTSTPILPYSTGYSTDYYWRVKVWDSQGASSNWATGSPFTIYHAYPSVDFSRTPAKPAVGEIVNFTDDSTCYDDVSNGGPCNTNDSFRWDFLPDGNPASSRVQNPTTTFASTGSKTVKLKVTDSDNFSCPGQKILNAQSRLPEWKEIKPF